MQSIIINLKAPKSEDAALFRIYVYLTGPAHGGGYDRIDKKLTANTTSLASASTINSSSLQLLHLQVLL